MPTSHVNMLFGLNSGRALASNKVEASLAGPPAWTAQSEYAD